MKLKVTLGRPNGSLQDIVVTTDASATVGEVAEAIRDLDPLGDRATVGTGPVTLRTSGADGVATSLAAGTPIGEAPIASGAAVVITPAVAPAHDDSTVLAVLRIVGGPDAGREFALREGGVVLGRAQTAAVRLDDPLVSKFHARIEIGRTLDLIDLNSANGLVIDGQQFSRVSLHTGQTVLVGGTLLRAEVLERAESSGAPRGPVQFNRSPRLEARYEGTEYKRPAAPTKLNRQPFPWIALAAPLLMGGGLFLFTQNPRMLLFVAIAPLIMVGTWLATRASNKRKHRDEVEAFEDQLSFLGESLEGERDAERQIRLLEAPSTAEVLAQTAVLGPLLWTRRPEHWTFLHLRLGTGLVASRNTIADRGDRNGLKEFVQRVDALEQHYERIDGVPVVEDLSVAGAIGITGLPDERARQVNALLVQLAGLYSPAEVEIAAIAGQRSAPQLEWLKWLPHSDAPNSPAGGALLADSAGSGVVVLSRLEELIERRAGGRPGQDRGPLQTEKSAMAAGAKAGTSDDRRLPDPPFVVVVVAADADVDRGRLIQLTERAADAGILPIWLADTVAELPAACRTFVELQPGAGTARVGFVRLGAGYENVQVESVGSETATAFARHLAGVNDAGIVSADASDVPKSIALAALIGTDMLEGPAAVVDRWRENDSLHDRRSNAPLSRRRTSGKLRAIVGKAAHEAMALDLRTNGPHALVGGTTGSGKSEFLQAWVLGMAAEYSPDRVTFLFVDYKGGSAFAECVQLPHCVGLVTDLSPHLVRRALTSLRAELHHREHLFNRKKVKDLLELERSGDPDSPPALVLVIDEFAALAKEVPEFVDGVVDIAQRGRSLGIHLIMATQRPAGVIKDNLRANTNLRIALRMADPADSQDVIGDKVAAGFDPGIPGRAIAKTGPTRLTTFQSAYAGGWTSSTPAPPEIGLGELRFGPVRRWERPLTAVSPDVDRGPNDQSRLVASIVGASARLELPAPRRPWLDELATVFDATKLRQRTDEELLLGVQDLPHLQRQDLAVFRPDAEGHLAIYGASGSGKTVTLRTLGTVAGITPRSGAVEVYGLDYAGNGLRMLEALPHVGSVINGDDTERVIRLLRQLKDELDRRSEQFAVVNAATIVEYRALSGQRDLPRILLLLDGYPAFRAAFEHVAASAVWYQRFMELLNEGRQLGIHVAITADRPGSVSTAVNSAIQRRVILRMSDEQAYLQIDAPRDILDASSAPGRAIIDGYESQIAIVGGSASALDQSKAIESLAAAMRRNGRTEAAPVRALPREYAPAELPASVDGRPVLGIGEDTLEPFAFEASGVMLLGGPPASGRSNALAWIARSVAAAHPVTTAYFGNPRSALVGSRAWDRVATTIEAAVEHARALSGELSAQAASGDDSVKHLIVIEGISDFLSTPADAPLTELIKAVKRSSSFLVGEGDTTAWSSSWPLMAEIKAARTGLLLQPESMEGDMILRTAFPRGQRSDFPVGRGFHVSRGRVARVQLPLLEE